MSRYRVTIMGTVDLDEIPGIDPLDERPAGEQLEGITTALFLRYIDAWQHLSIYVSERDEDGQDESGPLLSRWVTSKRGHGGWSS